MKLNRTSTTRWYSSIMILIAVSLLLITACSAESSEWENRNEEGTFLIFRRQSQIGEEAFSITSNKDFIIVKSLQGENERGRISRVVAELHLITDLVPTYYSNQRITDDTTIILKVEYIDAGKATVWEENFGGQVSITHTGKDTVTVKREQIPLNRYVVEGINWRENRRGRQI